MALRPARGYDFSQAPASTIDTSWINALANNPPVEQKKAAVPTQPLWKDMLGTLGGTSSIVTGSANSSIKKWSDLLSGKRSLAEIWKDEAKGIDAPGIQLAKAQINQWNNSPGFQWNDIPGLGTLNLANQTLDHGSDLLETFGVKNQGAQKWGGLALDIALDPITWLTGGSTAAMRAAGLTAAKAAAKTAGVATKAKSVEKIAEEVADAAVRKAVGNSARGLGKGVEETIYNTAKKQITDAVSQGRRTQQNAMFSLGIPFTDIAAGIGTKPLWAQKMAGTIPATIGTIGGAHVRSILDNLGLNSAQQRQFLQAKYGVDSAERMTEDGLRHLLDSVKKTDAPTAKLVQTETRLNPTVQYNKFDPDAFLGQLDPRISAVLEPMVRGLSKDELTPAILGSQRVAPSDLRTLNTLGADAADMYGAGISKFSNTTKGKTADAVSGQFADAAQGLRGASHTANIQFNPTPYYGDMVFSWLDSLMKNTDTFRQGEVAGRRLLPKIFNPRSLGGQDEFVNNSANAIRDAETKVFGQTQQLHNEKRALDKFVKDNNITDEDYKAVQYLMENKAPKGYTPDASRQAVVQQLADMLKPIMDRIGEQGMRSGVLDNLRENYFPHVINKEFDGEFVPRPLSGQSEVSGFNKDRRSFETMADLDDYIAAKHDEAMRATQAGDAEKAQAALEDAKQASELFERNSVEAVYERAKNGIRTNAMREMHNTLRDKGLIVPRDKVTGHHTSTGQFHTLTTKEASDLGMKQGDLIHEEVFNGMKKIEGLFGDEAKLNKLFETANTLTNLFKSAVTTAVPAHFWNNFIGNIFNNSLAGVRAKDYGAAVKLMRGLSKGKLDEKSMKVMQEAIDYGAFGQGFTSDFKRFMNKSEAKGTLERLEFTMRNMLEKTPWAVWGHKGENVTRLANFLNGKAKTGSAAKAAEQMRKYLFSYHEMTSADRAVRVAIPFWNWTKHNLPLQFEQLFKNTRIYENYVRVKDLWDEETDAEDAPEWAQDQYWRVPGTDMGIPLRLPTSDLDIASMNPLETIRDFGAMANPYVKNLAELSLNKQFFTGNPIDWDVPPNATPRLGPSLEYLSNQFGGVSKTFDLLNSSSGDDVLKNIIAMLVGKPFDYSQK